MAGPGSSIYDLRFTIYDPCRYIRGINMNKRFLFLIPLGLAALGYTQADPAIVAKIVDEGKNRNQVMDHLKYLTKNIGPRLTTSPQLEKACQWTMKKFREYGLQNVHLEQWGEWEVGFERGKRHVGRMVMPYEKNFEFTTSSWTPGTRGLTRGKAVLEPLTLDEYNKVKGQLKGAWLVSRRVLTFPRGTTPPEPTADEKALTDAIAKSGYVGWVRGSRNDLVITSGRGGPNLKWDNLPKEVSVMVRRKDMDSIMYHIEKGREVVLEFDLQQRFVRGPRKISNVIAEIPGTEKPDEIVIVSGHLDSWDGPGSEGALDNGTGTMVALEAARILMKTGARPKRTIRFILWTGEEQGLYGSRAYVEKHKDELGKISCVFVDDGGTNYQGGVSCTKEMEPMLREALKPAMDAFPELPIEIKVGPRIPRGGGSDHAPFNSAGVPGFFWFETGRSDYGYVHHTQHDKYEMAIPEYLVQSSTNSAAASYIIACAPSMLPREVPATPPPAGGGGGGR
jgi:carboxypeptidase Q